MKRAGVIAAAALALMALAGCSDTSPQATALASATALDPAALAAAPIAIVSLRGAPDAPQADFEAALRRELAARGVTTADEKDARYVVRGWLAARPGAEEATLSYVFDVYDRDHVRVGRLDAGFTVKGTGDAWSLMTPETLNAVAVQSAAEIAGFVSRNAPAPTPTALSYAPDQPL